MDGHTREAFQLEVGVSVLVAVLAALLDVESGVKPMLRHNAFHLEVGVGGVGSVLIVGRAAVDPPGWAVVAPPVCSLLLPPSLLAATPARLWDLSL